jgi:IS30 family transposase
LEKVHDKSARHVHDKFKDALAKLPATQRHSTTFDNGTEFARCHLVENSHGTRLYFADPGCPYQRGTNENTNGLLRQFFPKGTDFRTVTPSELRRVENLMNNRPRRCLGYRTPAEVFLENPPRSNCD